MFGFNTKKDDDVIETVRSRLRPLFDLLEHRLGDMPSELARDPYVIGYVVCAAMVFAMIETNGRASTELKGRVSLEGLQTAFASLSMNKNQASQAMHLMQGDPNAKRGADVADLILGVGAGKTDRDFDPRIVAAKASVAAMPEAVRMMLGSNERSRLLGELQEQLFFAPLEAKYRRR